MPNISEKIVAALPVPEAGNKLHYFSGATLQGRRAPSGFAVRVTSAGTKSFVWFHRVNGKPYWETLGRWDENAQGGTLTVRDAIIAADKRAKLVARGIDAKGNKVDPRPDRTRRLQDGDRVAGLDVAGLLDQFTERYIKKEAKLRSADQITDTFERLVKPAVGRLGVYEIRRSHVVSMLDDIADNSGPVMADRTLAYIRKAFNWYATRDDEFTPPIIKGMARTKPKERERDRILTDDELRTVWAVAETQGAFGRMVRFLLLTGTRRTEAAAMTWAELDGADWTLPAARNKTKVDLIRPLSATALATLPKRGAGPFVFSTDNGTTPLSGFSKFKAEFDRAAGVMPNWTLHDCRRSARSLMSRAGVPTDHAERALGHVVPGIRRVYDKHEYLQEKRDAFEKLAAMIDTILNSPKPSNVRTLRRAR